MVLAITIHPGVVTGIISTSSTGTRTITMVTGDTWMLTVLEAIGPTTYPGRGHTISTAVTETTGATETTMTDTTMTPSGGDPTSLGLKITTSRISDECLITAPRWATMARDPRTITALSTRTNWGTINSRCLHSTLLSRILAHPLLRNLLTIPSLPWITGLLWRDQ